LTGRKEKNPTPFNRGNIREESLSEGRDPSSFQLGREKAKSLERGERVDLSQKKKKGKCLLYFLEKRDEGTEYLEKERKEKERGKTGRESRIENLSKKKKWERSHSV